MVKVSLSSFHKRKPCNWNLHMINPYEVHVKADKIANRMLWARACFDNEGGRCAVCGKPKKVVKPTVI